MDHECAETFLRQFAEVQLRAAPGETRFQPVRWRVSTVGNALVRTGALDVGVADAIDDDVEVALLVRNPRPSGPAEARRPLPARPLRATRHLPFRPGPAWSRYQTGGAGTTPRPQPLSAPDRIIPLDLRIPLGLGQDRCLLHLLAFFWSGAAAWFPVYIRLTDPPPTPQPPGRFPSVLDLMRGMTMTDDTGASYRLGFAGGGNDQEGLRGEFRIHPHPPPGIGWVEITPAGEPAVRVKLTGTSPRPALMVSPAARTPGEYLLHTYAARLLGRGDAPLVEMLGDLVAALLAVGVLSPLSPVPGQLARLCERQGARGHGIISPPAREEDLPEQWRADARGQPRVPHPRDRFASAVLALPELDGVRLTVIGLVNSSARTTLHAHVAGFPAERRDDTLPILWIRDDRDGWHATGLSSWSSDGGVSRVQLTVWPPLNRASAIDILAYGQSAEVRTTLPLTWR
jgi:hypothetical protein